MFIYASPCMNTCICFETCLFSVVYFKSSLAISYYERIKIKDVLATIITIAATKITSVFLYTN